MPRYVVERTFPNGLHIPVCRRGGAMPRCRREERSRRRHLGELVRERGQAQDVLRLPAPTPEAIRKTAARSEVPVDRITRVRVLDPYFYV